MLIRLLEIRTNIETPQESLWLDVSTDNKFKMSIGKTIALKKPTPQCRITKVVFHTYVERPKYKRRIDNTRRQIGKISARMIGRKQVGTFMWIKVKSGHQPTAKISHLREIIAGRKKPPTKMTMNVPLEIMQKCLIPIQQIHSKTLWREDTW